MSDYTRVRNITQERLQADAYRQWRANYQPRPSFPTIVIDLAFWFALGAAAAFLAPKILAVAFTILFR